MFHQEFMLFSLFSSLVFDSVIISLVYISIYKIFSFISTLIAMIFFIFVLVLHHVDYLVIAMIEYDSLEAIKFY